MGQDEDYRRRELHRQSAQYQTRHNRNYDLSRESRPLSGPFFPFSLKFTSLVTRAANMIERTSINSVCIDTSSSHRPRFIVACFIQKSPTGLSSVFASETTIIPNFPMLPAILSMIFVPNANVIFRANPAHNKYLGAFVGGKLEFNFDAIFTDDDLKLVNHIRKLMSDSLTEQGILSDHSVELRRNLLGVTTKNRIELKPRAAPSSFRWVTNTGQDLGFAEQSRSFKSKLRKDSNNVDWDLSNESASRTEKKSEKPEKPEKPDKFLAELDFVPLDSCENAEEVPEEQEDSSNAENQFSLNSGELNQIVLFPSLSPISPSLNDLGADYDSEEDKKHAKETLMEDFYSLLFGSDDNETREEPEVSVFSFE